MDIATFAPTAIDWQSIAPEKTAGEKGFAISRTQAVGNITVRQIEYSANYAANHWCEKGHLVFVTEGTLLLEHKNQATQTIEKGMSYFVGDASQPHKAISKSGAKIFIVD